MQPKYNNWIQASELTFPALKDNEYLKKVMSIFDNHNINPGTNGTYYYYGKSQTKVEIRRNMYYKNIGLFKFVATFDTDKNSCKILNEKMGRSEKNRKRTHDIVNYLGNNSLIILNKTYIFSNIIDDNIIRFESDLKRIIKSIDKYKKTLAFNSSSEELKLKKVMIENFKSIKTSEISFDENLQLLVGVNNAGKTSFLQGIILAYRSLDRLFEDNKLAFKNNELIVGYSVQGVRINDIPFLFDNYRELFHVDISYPNKPIKFCRFEFQNGLYIDFGMSLIGEVFSVRVINCSVGILKTKLERFLNRSVSLIPSFFTVTLNEERKSKGRYNSLLKSGNYNQLFRNILIDLKEFDEDDSDLENDIEQNIIPIGTEEENKKLNVLTDNLQRLFNIQNLRINFDPLKDEFIKVTYPIPKTNGESVEMDISSLGMGTLQFIQVVAQTLLGTPFLVLIDEPDAHLNANLQKEVIRFFENLSINYNVNFLISTHSKDIINCVSPKQVLHLRNGHISNIKNTNNIIEIFKELGASTEEIVGISIGKRIILVEGSDDANYIKHLCSVIGIDRLNNYELINFMDFGGRSGVLTNQLEKYIQHNFDDIKKLAIFDRDYRFLSSQIDDAEKLRKKGFDVLEWSKKEFENYLLNYNLIIKTLQKEYYITITTDELDSVINKYFEKVNDDVCFEIEKNIVLQKQKELRKESGIKVKKLDLSKKDEIECRKQARQYLEENNLKDILCGKDILNCIRISFIKNNTPSQSEFIFKLIDNINIEETHDDIKKLIELINSMAQ